MTSSWKPSHPKNCCRGDRTRRGARIRPMAAIHSTSGSGDSPSGSGDIGPVPHGTKGSPSQYACVEALHTDGVTTLFRARDETTGQSVLLKVVDPRRSSRADLERLDREYEMATSLHLETVARALGIETREGAPALVLQDTGGEPLDRAFAQPLPLDRFLDLAVRIVGAVADLHKEGVVHKDIKPQNILVHPTTHEVKLVGLGLATRLPRERPPARPAHLVEGSLPYMSPEQTGRTNSALDSRSDLYSLGATLYQLLTGRLLCEARDPLEWLHFHAARTPAPASQFIAGLPDVVSRIILRLLAKAAEDRYQTARGLEHDLNRCRESWRESGRIDPFPLGEQDIPHRLQFPHKIYGRRAETAELVGTLKRVVDTGASELIVISGYSGVGKSTLASQLAGPSPIGDVQFVTGKANPYQRDLPYSTLAQAFGELVLRLIAEGEEKSALWRRRVQEALGTNGQLVIAAIPQVELLVGAQPPIPEFAPAEAQIRFRTVFRRFVSVLARAEHPLVLFLDDLQWADSDSLPLLQDLVTDPEVRFLLVVGAYRDNQVTPDHPLSVALDATEAAGGRVSRIVLGPLSDTALTEFVGDTLRCPPPEAALLAKAVQDKTAGNPFFFIQFLSELQSDGLLHLDEDAGVWRWDIDGLQRRGFADNVAELMVAQLKRLPTTSQEALEHLACFADDVESKALSWLIGRSEGQVRAALWQAVAEGFVVTENDRYRFTHDSFREAAYSQIPEEARPEAHLRIGRLLLAHLPEDTIEEHAFEVANHLDRGLELIHDPSERDVVRRWNTVAGRRAKQAVAYASAATYLKHAAELLPSDAWHNRYDETFALHVELCECEYLSGHFTAGEALCARILEQVRSDRDRARVHRLRIRMYELAGWNDEAMTVAADALRPFGLNVPETHEDIEAATQLQERLVAEFVRGRPIAGLADMTPASDPDMQAALGVIADSLSPAYMAQRAHFPLFAAMGVNICLRNGHSAESSSIYNSYALGRAGVGDYQRAFDFSDLAIRLLSQVESLAARGIVLFRHGFFIHPWRQHLSTSLPYLHQSESACREGGNLLYAGYARFAAIETAIELGTSLDEIDQATRDAAELTRQARSDAVRDTLLVQHQFAACLKGMTREPGSLEDAAFSEANGVVGFAQWRHLVLKQVVSYIFGRYDVAVEAGELASTALRGVVSLMLVATHHFFRALSLAALSPDSGDARRATLRSALEEELRLHKQWADHCPPTFESRHALVAAEVARIDGRELEAERRYEEAIRSAREHGFVNNEAVAYELAARFHRARGLDLVADTYLREARACYLRWGAAGKVRQLEELHPQLAGATTPVADPIGSTFAAGADRLDLLSVVKASQTISREIEIDRLVGTLFTIVIQHSGARRGCLLLARDGALTALAEATLDDTGVVTRILSSQSSDPSLLMPRSVMRRAQATRQPIVLDEAALRAGGSGDDPYLARRRPRSALTLPILRGDDLLGLLYLENDLVSGAFVEPGLVTTLSLLASQVAISMENALYLAQIRELNQDLELRVARRTAELAEANRELEAFACTVSHDLRAPLRAIDGYRGVLERQLAGAIDGPARHQLDHIAQGVSRMRCLIDDLLSFARLARVEMSSRPVNLGALTRDVVQELARDAADRDVTWIVAELPVVTGDPAMLRVVLMNLLSNALKFTGREAHAVIEVGTHREEDGTTVVFVRDNGAGFDMTQADKLFGAFQRLHSVRDFPGTGIGLASVRRVIARLGGRTWAEGAAGEGATFYFSVPGAR
ncbi:MAG TPA: AAA family ATPase [Kineosporiaceae bacterium]